MGLNFLNTTHLNEVFKIFIEKINLPKNSINEFIFLLDGNKLDIKSEKSLSKCGIINNQIIIVMYDLENNHEIINLFNLRKNICIYHNKKFMYYCLQCNNEMCQQCLEIIILRIIQLKKWKTINIHLIIILKNMKIS